MSSFLRELKHRRVYRVAIGYAVAAWLAIQIAATVLPAFHAPEKIVQAQPIYGPAISILGLIDAGLGNKAEALREGRRAVELLPVTKDSVNGAHIIQFLAITAAWVGEKDLACEQLAIVTRMPGPLSYGQLKLFPMWDPLRGDPRFEKIVAALAPQNVPDQAK